MNSKNLHAYYPDLRNVLEESDEEFALVILELLRAQERENKRPGQIRRPLEIGGVEYQLPPPPAGVQLRPKLEGKIEDAFRWLTEKRLIRPEPGINGRNGKVEITELGWQTDRNQRGLLEATRMLPDALIHPKILARIRDDFRKGDYDKAVQDAFKQVEVATRAALGLDDTVHGEALFKRAFRSGSAFGKKTQKLEQERNLFISSYNLYRHPPSHSNTKIVPAMAARMLALASHLMYRLQELAA
jgi:uncharacterized protein (TIGR02391 family)